MLLQYHNSCHWDNTRKKNKHNKKDSSMKQLHNCMPMEMALATIFESMKRSESFRRIKWNLAWIERNRKKICPMSKNEDQKFVTPHIIMYEDEWSLWRAAGPIASLSPSQAPGPKFVHNIFMWAQASALSIISPHLSYLP